MLIEFSVANFRSFKTMQTLRMQAAPIRSKNPKLDVQNTCQLTDKLSVVKSKLIYGANASGKSNLVKALMAFLEIVQHSFQNEQVLQTWIFPHLMEPDWLDKPTFFQIQFRLNERHYRYGFETTRTEIISEWLYSSDGKKPESYHFRRNRQDITVNPRTFKEGARLIVGSDEMPPMYRKNALFLPVVAAFNGPVSVAISHYFADFLLIFNGLEDDLVKKNAMDAFGDDIMRAKMANLLRHADVGIEQLEMLEVPEEMLSGAAKEYHKKRAREGKKTFLVLTKRSIEHETGGHKTEIPILLDQESYGTQKLFWMSPFLVTALEKGGILILDEFGSSLHVKIIRAIIELFHSPITNPHNAQLIAATHDTHLLDQRLMRRDQIAIVEKNSQNYSVLRDLVEFKGVRNDVSLENDYLQGRYGGIPFINQFDWAFIPDNHEKTQQENGSK